MSSPTITTTATGADASPMATATTTVVERQTYWCHECDMSVSLLSPSPTGPTSLLCPYCHSDFLEELDSPLFNPNPNPSRNPNPNSNPSNIPNLSPFPIESSTTTFQFPSAVNPSDDNFLLDSPYLHRLIHHLTTSDNSSETPSSSRHHCPASKSAVDSIPTITVTETFLSPDPIVLCAVCKDQFVIDDETKQLPCKHLYHPDCILPWLSQHNSCPVCRFQLPVDGGNGDSKGRRRRTRILRLEELMGYDEELFGFGDTLRHIARRHRSVLPNGRRGEEEVREDESLFSPTQIAEADEMVGLDGRANSVETVSSWPSWGVEGAVGVGSGGGGGGEGEIGVVTLGAAALVNDDGDIVMS